MKKFWLLLLLLPLCASLADDQTGTPGTKKRRPLPHEYGKVVIDKYSAQAGFAPVRFDHWLHRAKFTCRAENILLHEGQALVADFGIALAVSRSDGGTRMTETGMSLGTPHYMAPEQAMGEREITPKADIYALGCVLYEMLTAEPPFTGATAQAIVARVMTEQRRPLTAQRRTIPPHIEAAVQQALEKLPADRFASAREFAEALDGRAAGRSAVRSAVSTSATGRPSVRPTALAAGVALLAVAAIAVAVMTRAPALTSFSKLPTPLRLSVCPSTRSPVETKISGEAAVT